MAEGKKKYDIMHKIWSAEISLPPFVQASQNNCVMSDSQYNTAKGGALEQRHLYNNQFSSLLDWVVGSAGCLVVLLCEREAVQECEVDWLHATWASTDLTSIWNPLNKFASIPAQDKIPAVL